MKKKYAPGARYEASKKKNKSVSVGAKERGNFGDYEYPASPKSTPSPAAAQKIKAVQDAVRSSRQLQGKPNNLQDFLRDRNAINASKIKKPTLRERAGKVASRVGKATMGAGRMIGGATLSVAGVPQAGVPMARQGAREFRSAVGFKKQGMKHGSVKHKSSSMKCKTCGKVGKHKHASKKC